MDARERWRVDSERSTLTFSIRHAFLRQIRGQFHCWGGLVLLDRARPRGTTVRMWVDLSSIDTGSAKRDKEFLATELLEPQWEPGLVFDSERVDIAGVEGGVEGGIEGGVIIGKLALHGSAREITVAVEPGVPRGGASGARRLVYTARTSIDRGAFG